MQNNLFPIWAKRNRFIQIFFVWYNWFTKTRDELLHRPVVLLDRFGFKPNVVSLLGVVWMLFFVVSFSYLSKAALIFLFFSIAADFLDGSLARFQKTASDLGRLVDLVSDSLCFSIFITSLFFNHWLSWLLTSELIITFWLVTFLNTFSAQLAAKQLNNNIKNLRGFWVLPCAAKIIFYSLGFLLIFNVTNLFGPIAVVFITVSLVFMFYRISLLVFKKIC